MSSDGVRASVEKMRAAGTREATIAAFSRAYAQLEAGHQGILAERDLSPLEDLAPLDEAVDIRPSQAAIDRLAIVKLNGGLGTSMGIVGAKSLQRARGPMSFLDVIVSQVLCLRRQTGARLPLVLLNSFATHHDSLKALERTPLISSDVPATLVQHAVPRLREEDLQPLSWPSRPALEWAPPGHGDLYGALLGSGMLQLLLDAGYEYAFVSSADNLAAFPDPATASWLVQERVPMLMEVAERTPADRKGGHLARRRDGRLVLRDWAQAADADRAAFLDVDRHRFFNTNTLWVRLPALADVLSEREGLLGLPVIVNRKHVVAGDRHAPRVVQLESAMGAAIEVFPDAVARRVPRARFAHVKTNEDLLVIRSDAYTLTDDWRLELVTARQGQAPLVSLDPEFFGRQSDFENRFAFGPPSLARCERLTVVGDVSFGRDVVVRGSVSIAGNGGDPVHIPDGTVLEG